MSAAAPGTIPCPGCGAPLPLPVETVLAGDAVVCRSCGLELAVQREVSREALAALACWYEETAEAPDAARLRSGGPGKRRPRR